MGATRVFEDIDHPRRRFIGAAAMTVAAAQFGMGGSAEAQTGATKPNLPAIKPGTNTTFAPLKQIDAGSPECRIRRGRPRRWPCSSSAARLGLRHLQLCRCRPSAGVGRLQGRRPLSAGYGSTRFLSSETFRNGQQSAVAVDIVALMDVLKIEKATLGGSDWGARTADIIAALWPERCEGLVSVSGYLIGSQEAGKAPLPPAAEFQ
jgi:pimeloyl-ACP methyl ester carboxylesterase